MCVCTRKQNIFILQIHTKTIDSRVFTFLRHLFRFGWLSDAMEMMLISYLIPEIQSAWGTSHQVVGTYGFLENYGFLFTIYLF